MSATMFGGAVVSTECSNCDADAEYDVEVLATDSGEVVRDVYACETCADEISVSSDAYYVSLSNL